MNAILRNSALALFGAAPLLAFLALLSLAGLRVNLTPSLPEGVYVLCPGTPGRGDLASFCLEGEFAELARERGYLQAGSCASGLRPLLKTLAGLPGDVILGDLFIHASDSLGRAMPSVLPEGIIPPGMALVLADHPGSYDSRYFGLVPLDALQRVKPVFVCNPQQGQSGELP
jgi:conjugative transfer signal peptidase TraF